jgi:hypothetical protein
MPLVCLIIACVPGGLRARGIEDWPYQKLFEKADLVVIAKVLSEKDTGDKVKHDDQELFRAILTTFEVQYIVKGEHKEKNLVVFHYRLDRDELERIYGKWATVGNGPLLATFHKRRMSVSIKGTNMTLPEPVYMLFLKTRKDGRYECVSGQFDSR